jgi:phosphoglycolate phosphatase
MIIFFDLDGPILDVSERYFRLHRHIVGQFGGRVMDKGTYWHLKRDRQSLSILLGMTGGHISEEAYRAQWFHMIELPEYLQYDTIISGAREQLERLGQCHTLVLVTLRRQPDHLEAQLKQLQLSPFFAAVLSADSTVTDGLETKKRLIRASGFLTKGALVVGDTEIDIRTGKALGLKTVAVLSGIRNRNRLAEERPDCIVENINTLPQLERDA